MKNKSRILNITILSAVLALSGCATSQVAKEAKGTGIKKTYEKSSSIVWDAMKEAVSSTGGEITEENKRDCSILADYSVSAFSWGERVGIFCTELGSNKTETEVVSKRAVSVNISSTDWTEEIYKILDKELK